MSAGTSVVRVNPVSIRQYADSASQRFAAARQELETMVREAVEVHYYGRNAYQFKADCGRLAADYSDRLLKDFTQIADAVRVSTSNISSSLGGDIVSIAIDGKPISVPSTPQVAEGVVDVNVNALKVLMTGVTAHIGKVQVALQEHLVSLKATDWEGQAKASAVDAVAHFTQQAENRAGEAGTQINEFIRQQVDAVFQADR